MREIVLDTETTGLDARKTDRLIEIGCIELINHFPTGREFHRFINPDGRDVPQEAVNIHGITGAFLKDKPLFKTEVTAFLDFIGDDILIIHNAPFDIGFLNMELERVGKLPIMMTRVLDTLQLARRKHPGAPATLDALCKRYNIDNTKRTKHGAIVDSILLAEVYVELIGAKQATLSLTATQSVSVEDRSNGLIVQSAVVHQRPKPLARRLTDQDLKAHAAFVETLGANAKWKRVQ
jgi:DNA polymerase III subunit epsilon